MEGALDIPGFWQAAAANPDRIALVEPAGREITAGALVGGAHALTHGLRALGLETGDALTVALPNGAPMVEAFLAAMQAGWYITPINPNLTGPEIGYIVKDSGAKAFIGSEAYAEAAVRAADEAGLAPERRFAVGDVPGFRAYAELANGQPTTLPGQRRAGQMMQYTSGTTGRPKGVRRPLLPLDPELMIRLYARHLTFFGIEPGGDGVHLCGSPMYHLAALAYCWFPLHFEHKVVLMSKWSPEGALELIDRHRVTNTHMVPTQFRRLTLLPDEVKRRYDLSSLRQVIHAAAPCPVALKRKMLDWWGPVIWEYYGASEGGGTIVSPEDWLAHPGSVGRPWPGADVKILDDDGKPCPAGQVGGVYLKLLADFEYHGDQEKTRKNRQADYFTVGDVGYLDEEGWLYLCDRKIDMIISGGVNIYPAEVESALLESPRVGDVAVFGIPDDDWGEQVKAVVEPAPGVAAGPELEASLLDFCRERLAKYKCPRSIDFTEAMPRDPNGKLYKRRLRDPYWEGRTRQI